MIQGKANITTFCTCWHVERKDRKILGFTNHDHSLFFDDVEYQAQSGFATTAIETRLGMSVDNTEILCALNADMLTDDDIRSGMYDSAIVSVWRVNWADVNDKKLLHKFEIGEITRIGTQFKAELLGVTDALNLVTGKSYIELCNCLLGDARCGVDLSDSKYQTEAVIISIKDDVIIEIENQTSFKDRWFERGLLVLQTGRNSNKKFDIHQDTTHGRMRVLKLWRKPSYPLLLGDQIQLVAGCDKRLQTCSSIFQNSVNFRGFPHMPGDDWITSYPKREDKNDGTSLFK